MTTEDSDNRLQEMIVNEYRKEHFAVTLEQVVRGKRQYSLRPWLAAAAVAGLVLVVAVGAQLIRPGGAAGPDGPGGVATSRPSATNETSKPPRPTSSATTAAGRCADFGSAELAASTWLPADLRRSLPPLRFQLTLIDSQLDLLLYANADLQVACFLSSDRHEVYLGQSTLDTGDGRHPAGQLSYSSMANATEPHAAFALGRVPVGVTAVKIFFPDGTAVPAQLSGDWFVAWATGAAAGRFADVTKVVATGPGVTYTLPVQHG